MNNFAILNGATNIGENFVGAAGCDYVWIWANFNTLGTKSKIKSWISKQNRTQHLENGQEQLSTILKEATLDLLESYGALVAPMRKHLAQVAFEFEGKSMELPRNLGMKVDDLATFPAAFHHGMTEPWRARALGDVGSSAPEKFAWGGSRGAVRLHESRQSSTGRHPSPPIQSPGRSCAGRPSRRIPSPFHLAQTAGRSPAGRSCPSL